MLRTTSRKWSHPHRFTVSQVILVWLVSPAIVLSMASSRHKRCSSVSLRFVNLNHWAFFPKPSPQFLRLSPGVAAIKSKACAYARFYARAYAPSSLASIGEDHWLVRKHHCTSSTVCHMRSMSPRRFLAEQMSAFAAKGLASRLLQSFLFITGACLFFRSFRDDLGLLRCQ